MTLKLLLENPETERVNFSFTTLSGREAKVLGRYAPTLSPAELQEIVEEADAFYGVRGCDWDLCVSSRIQDWEKMNLPFYIIEDVETGNLWSLDCNILDYDE